MLTRWIRHAWFIFLRRDCTTAAMSGYSGVTAPTDRRDATMTVNMAAKMTRAKPTHNLYGVHGVVYDRVYDRVEVSEEDLRLT